MKKLQRWHSRLGLSSVGHGARHRAPSDLSKEQILLPCKERRLHFHVYAGGLRGEWVGAPGSPPLPLEQRCQVPHEAAAASTLDEAGAAEGGRRQWLLVSLVSGSYQPDDCRPAPPSLSLSFSPMTFAEKTLQRGTSGAQSSRAAFAQSASCVISKVNYLPSV